MDNVVILKGDKGQLDIEILKYENPNARTIDDANWLLGRLSISAGPFSGSIGVSMTTNELENLHRQLGMVTNNLRGQIDFASLEGNLRIRIHFGSTGTAVVTGIVTPDEADETALHFGFNADPINLEACVLSFGHLLQQFPVKHSINIPVVGVTPPS
jgi:hypothetical protein